MELQELRGQIDHVDNQMLELIVERRGLISQIAEIKKQSNIPVFAPARESEILDRLSAKLPQRDKQGLRLLYQILMDLNKFHEYFDCPKSFVIPTEVGGASIRAILSDTPGSLCRYLSPLAAAGVSIASIQSKAMPGGKLVVDIEVQGQVSDPAFASALSVLSDTAEKFTLL